MNHRFALPALLFTLVVTLAACTGEIAFPSATVETVTPSEVTTAGGTLTIEGANFFQYEDGARTHIETCGVSVPAEIVSPTVQTILLPPGDRVRVEAGTTLTATLPDEGLEAGVSDLRIVRPNGTSSVIENAITCVANPDQEPTPDPVFVNAALSANTTHGPAPLTVDFDASDSTGEGDLTYTWDFGNGHTSTSATSSQTFPTPGTYTVTLTITDEAGESDTATETITVTDSTPTARATIQLQPVWIEAEEGEEPADGYVVTFDGTASSDPNGDDLTYSWSIFDETLSTDATFTPPEPAPADTEFVITLTVTDPHGNSDDAALYTFLDPQDDHYADKTPQPDILRLSWRDSHEGGIILELETATEHPILQPGQQMECEAPEPRLVALQATDHPMVGLLPFRSTPDADEGEESIPGFPGGDQAITLTARNADGSFPILDSGSSGCNPDTLHTATVTQNGPVLTFHLPETAAPEAHLFTPGAILGSAETLDVALFGPSDIAPNDSGPGPL